MDVTKLIFQHITPEVSVRIGALIGRPREEAAGLMAAAVPAVLATLLDMTEDEDVEEAVRRAPQDALQTLSDTEPEAMDAAARDGLAQGSDLVGKPCFAALAAALERHARIDRDQALRIMGLAMRFSIAGIAEAGRAQSLDVRESLRMFARQTGSVALAIPGAFAEKLAERRLLQGLGDRAVEARAEARPAGGTTNRPGAPVLPAQPGSAWWRWVIPGVALLVALAIALAFLSGAPAPTG
jgi:hypothetical protein